MFECNDSIHGSLQERDKHLLTFIFFSTPIVHVFVSVIYATARIEQRF